MDGLDDCLSQRQPCADFLLKAGTNQDIRSIDEETALSLASRKGHQACIQLLQQALAASAYAAAMSSLLDDLEEKGKRGANDACGRGKEGQQGLKLGMEEVTHAHMHTHTHTRAR